MIVSFLSRTGVIPGVATSYVGSDSATIYCIIGGVTNPPIIEWSDKDDTTVITSVTPGYMKTDVHSTDTNSQTSSLTIELTHTDLGAFNALGNYEFTCKVTAGEWDKTIDTTVVTLTVAG